MSNITTHSAQAPAAVSDDELCRVLQSSLYPGASLASIAMVVAYCNASSLDVFQKPVHIVPMRVKRPGGGRDDYEWRDVVMPGIGLYRIQAARTGSLAGIDEPEFGPMVAGWGIEYPEWCKVTVYRLIGGVRMPFTAREYWTENYSTTGRDSTAPNAMWKRRPRGQIAKCAEAQALRKAFPELGSQPTSDETLLDPADVFDVPVSVAPAPVPAPRVARRAPAVPADADDAHLLTPPPQPDPSMTPAAPAPAPARAPAAAPAAAATDPGEATQLVGVGEQAYLKAKARAVGVDLAEELVARGLVLETLTRRDFAAIKSDLLSRSA